MWRITGSDVAHHDGKLTKITHHIELAKQKADKTLISEAPTNTWIKRYEEALKAEGPEETEETHTKGKARAKPWGKRQKC